MLASFSWDINYSGIVTETINGMEFKFTIANGVVTNEKELWELPAELYTWNYPIRVYEDSFVKTDKGIVFKKDVKEVAKVVVKKQPVKKVSKKK